MCEEAERKEKEEAEEERVIHDQEVEVEEDIGGDVEESEDWEYDEQTGYWLKKENTRDEAETARSQGGGN